MQAATNKITRFFGLGLGTIQSSPNKAIACDKPWRPKYGFLALAFALTLYGFDALETIIYDHARAPNVGLPMQLALLLVVYVAWAVVPRGIWTALRTMSNTLQGNLKTTVARLIGFGTAAYGLHMLLLAIILRIMYSPPGWSLGDLGHSVFELMIQQAALWWLAFSGAVGLIWRAKSKNLEQSERSAQPIYQVRHGNKIVPVRTTDIHWIEAADNYVTLHTDEAGYLYRKSISALEAETEPFGLVRAHRSALVNMSFVKTISRDANNGSYHIELQSGDKVPLSRRRLSQVKARFA